jgi:hypothetical protein
VKKTEQAPELSPNLKRLQQLMHYSHGKEAEVEEVLTALRVPPEAFRPKRVEEARQPATPPSSDASDWGWEELRDYAVSEMERLHGPSPRDTKKETVIFQAFFDHYGNMAVPIAQFAFGPACKGIWKGAPISVPRFDRVSYSYFGDVIHTQLRNQQAPTPKDVALSGALNAQGGPVTVRSVIDQTNEIDEFAAMEEELEVKKFDWDPLEGDHIVGYFELVEVVTRKDGGKFQVLHLKMKDGGIARVPAGRASLKNQLEAKKAQPGDLIGIKYVGEIEPANGGRSFNKYTVRVRQIGDRGPDVFVAHKPTESPDGLVDGSLPIDDGDDADGL